MYCIIISGSRGALLPCSGSYLPSEAAQLVPCHPADGESRAHAAPCNTSPRVSITVTFKQEASVNAPLQHRVVFGRSTLLLFASA